jgi:low affinity Fe/Cu permease
MKELFRKFASHISKLTGTAGAFVLAISVVLIWGFTGPLFSYSDTWQLVINTSTTIVTFLMVFLIQNTQNRDGKAMQLKLDELIRSSASARNSFVYLEDMTDDDLEELDKQFHKLHEHITPHPLLHKLHASINTELKRRKNAL